MKIDDVIWLEDIVEKIEAKHGVSTWEVEEVFRRRPQFRRGPKGRRRGENLYFALGDSEAGRYLFIVFVLKRKHKALVISAREMTNRERRGYRKRK